MSNKICYISIICNMVQKIICKWCRFIKEINDKTLINDIISSWFWQYTLCIINNIITVINWEISPNPISSYYSVSFIMSSTLTVKWDGSVWELLEIPKTKVNVKLTGHKAFSHNKHIRMYTLHMHEISNYAAG